MRIKLIALEVVLLIVFAGFYVWSIQEEPTHTQVGTGADQPVFANLDVSRVKTIELHAGEDNLVLRKVSGQDQQPRSQSGGKGQQKKQPSASSVQPTMDKGPYRADSNPKWVISSYHNYGVKQDQVQNRIIKPLRKLKRGTVQARTKSNLKEFGLNKKNRRRIVLKDDSNNVVREVVLGKRVTGFTDTGPGQFGGGGGDQESIYYYNATNPEEFEIRLGKSEFSELPLDPQEWVNKKLLSYNEEDVPLIAMKHGEKLFVLRRETNKKKKKGTSEGSEGSGDNSSSNSSDSGSGSSSGNNDGSSESEPKWTLYTGNYYADELIPRNAPVLWENQKLKWKGQRGNIQSIPLTKSKLKQSEADSLASTLSSLSADQVKPPISVPVNQQTIPAEKKAKYGLNSPTTVLYLGEWRKPGRVMVLRARFHVGKTSEDGEEVYISSLKTTNMARQVIQTIAGLGGRFGGGQAEQLIPVYTLSSMDRGTLVSPGDLIKKEDSKIKNKEDKSEKEKTDKGGNSSSRSSGGSSTGSSKDTNDSSTAPETGGGASSSGRAESDSGGTNTSKEDTSSSSENSNTSPDSDGK